MTHEKPSAGSRRSTGSRRSPSAGARQKTSPERHTSPARISTPVRATTPSAISRVAHALEKRARLGANAIPRIDSFLDFLTAHARVKSGSGYVAYHFKGREALEPIVRQLDALLASGATDASLALCGGAQFGKTVLMLNLLAYLVAVRFRNVGYYLPDDDLVAGLVDGKLRPDVLDQIPWLARLLQVGKTLAPTGRAVNRKGAFLCTDGKHSALAFMRGLGKIPTSFSMDVVIQDEKDDLPEEHARFLSGRMTASDLRLSLIIGTQRYHGAGQNLAFTEGTQHIGLVRCPACAKSWNPETAWPDICRLRVESATSTNAPRLSSEGHFVWGNKTELTELTKLKEGNGHPTAPSPNPVNSVNSVQNRFPIPYAPGQSYYLGCPACGSELDRDHPEWHALAPDRAALRRWSYRLSQLLFPDIDLAQIVAAWQLAIRDPAQMTVFCTDRLALPKSLTQTLTPHDLAAARGNYALGDLDGMNGVAKFDPQTNHVSSANLLNSVNSVQNSARFGGLDLGDQCWFVARAVDLAPPHRVRLLWAESIAAERVRARVPELFRLLHLRALCVDAGPLRDLARDLAFALNELDEDAAASSDDAARNIYFSRHGATLPLRWLASTERWENVRCLPVEFTQREGAGIRHKVARTQEGRIYPLLAAHREESIARVIGELLADPSSRTSGLLLEGPDGIATRTTGPRFLLPTATDATRGVLDVYERHLLAGSRQERTADGKSLRFLDKCENHFLLATAYAALAELLTPLRSASGGSQNRPAGFHSVSATSARTRPRTVRGVEG